MKVRIQGDSIRLRLTRSEVANLLSHRPIVETTHLPGATLRFELEAGPADGVEVSFDARRLRVRIEAALADAFRHDDHVGFERAIAIDAERTLHVSIEKDFACLDRATPEPDAFPNPKACDAIGALAT